MMNRVYAVCFCALVICGSGSLSAQRLHPVDPGRDLFVHEWTPFDALSKAGDGLGPMHNDVSCVACHHLGGVGGAGANDKNVDLLSLASPDHRLHQHLVQVHPGFRDGRTTTLVLHRQSADTGYEDWRLRLLGVKLSADLSDVERTRVLRSHERRRGKLPPVTPLSHIHAVRLQLSQRNTPALFGAGLIDQMSRQLLDEQVRVQERRSDGVSGRVSQVGTGVGRFGWRAQTASLRDFVLGACANELGLEVPGTNQPDNPLNASYKTVGLDLTERQCDDLVDFVAQLPRPLQIKPSRLEDAQLIELGRRHFHQTGCAVCHVERLGDVDGIYTDLLLHDMGPEMSDPSPAMPQTIKAGSRVTGGGPYGVSFAVDMFATVHTEIEQEWRTPPLWGVRDSAPFLHDGRAATLRDAIAWHGGEAPASRAAFMELPRFEQTQLLAFLQTLAAPR